jgi:thioredoxin-like negative regulator of GroEL
MCTSDTVTVVGLALGVVVAVAAFAGCDGAGCSTRRDADGGSTQGGALVDAGAPPGVSASVLALVARKGDALALSDALDVLASDGKATQTDRAYVLEIVRSKPEDTAAYAFARASIAARVAESRGAIFDAALGSEVERWAQQSRKLDPHFRAGAATRLLGTLYVVAPAGSLEHADAEEGLEALVKAYPETPENRMRLADAYVIVGDPTAATPHLCRALADRAKLGREDRARLDYLVVEANRPRCMDAP